MIGIVLLNIAGALFSADIIRKSIRNHNADFLIIGIILLIGNLICILINYPKIS